jgi:hypothetical protein
LTNTTRRVGIRCHTSGAVKAPIDCAISATSARRSTAVYDRVGVGRQASAATRCQIHGDHVVAATLQVALDQVPVPAHATRPGNEHHRCHLISLLSARSIISTVASLSAAPFGAWGLAQDRIGTARAHSFV